MTPLSTMQVRPVPTVRRDGADVLGELFVTGPANDVRDVGSLFNGMLRTLFRTPAAVPPMQRAAGPMREQTTGQSVRVHGGGLPAGAGVQEVSNAGLRADSADVRGVERALPSVELPPEERRAQATLLWPKVRSAVTAWCAAPGSRGVGPNSVLMGAGAEPLRTRLSELFQVQAGARLERLAIALAERVERMDQTEVLSTIGEEICQRHVQLLTGFRELAPQLLEIEGQLDSWGVANGKAAGRYIHTPRNLILIHGLSAAAIRLAEQEPNGARAHVYRTIAQVAELIARGRESPANAFDASGEVRDALIRELAAPIADLSRQVTSWLDRTRAVTQDPPIRESKQTSGSSRSGPVAGVEGQGDVDALTNLQFARTDPSGGSDSESGAEPAVDAPVRFQAERPPTFNREGSSLPPPTNHLERPGPVRGELVDRDRPPRPSTPPKS